VLNIFMEMANETLDSYLLREHRRTARWDDKAKRKDHVSTSVFTAIITQVCSSV
jgi:hypothetical protein